MSRSLSAPFTYWTGTTSAGGALALRRGFGTRSKKPGGGSSTIIKRYSLILARMTSRDGSRSMNSGRSAMASSAQSPVSSSSVAASQSPSSSRSGSGRVSGAPAPERGSAVPPWRPRTTGGRPPGFGAEACRLALQDRRDVASVSGGETAACAPIIHAAAARVAAFSGAPAHGTEQNARDDGSYGFHVGVSSRKGSSAGFANNASPASASAASSARAVRVIASSRMCWRRSRAPLREACPVPAAPRAALAGSHRPHRRCPRPPPVPGPGRRAIGSR